MQIPARHKPPSFDTPPGAIGRYTQYTVPRITGIDGPYRLFFYSTDCGEPVHVHVLRDRATCKFWLDPVSLADNHGMSPRDLTAARRIIFEHRPRIMEAWYEHCGETG